MDDDTRVFKIQVKGTAYSFRPIPEEAVERVALINSLSVSGTKVIKTLTQALAQSAGPEQWDKLTDLWVAGEVSHKEITVGLFEEILKRQGEQATPKPRARKPRAK